MKYDYSSSKHPATVFVLRGLLPYTEESLMLAFKPKRFFYELSKQSGYPETRIKSAYYRAKRLDLLTADAVPRLTEKGLRKVAPYTADYLGEFARLIVFFDIPEERTAVRSSFRALLKQLGFTMAQQSVWTCEWDHRATVAQAIKEFRLEDCVEMHESVRLFPK